MSPSSALICCVLLGKSPTQTLICEIMTRRLLQAILSVRVYMPLHSHMLFRRADAESRLLQESLVHGQGLCVSLLPSKFPSIKSSVIISRLITINVFNRRKLGNLLLWAHLRAEQESPFPNVPKTLHNKLINLSLNFGGMRALPELPSAVYHTGEL